MNAKPLAPLRDARAYVLAFEKDDEVLAVIEAFARETGLGAAHFTAIGAFREAELAYFDWESKEYVPIRVDEQVEVVSLTGNIAHVDGEPTVHIHCVVARRDGSTVGGHLRSARVRPTLELFLSTSASKLEKRHDAETGLDLLATTAEVGSER